MNTIHNENCYSAPRVVVLGSLVSLTSGDVKCVSCDWDDSVTK